MTLSLPAENWDANGEVIVQLLKAAQAAMEHNLAKHLDGIAPNHI
jgi:hypothetical protein